MKAIGIILVVLGVVGFITLGIQSVENTNNTTQLKELQFKTLDSQLNEKTIQIEDINKQLEDAKKNNQTSTEKIKELQEQKDKWEQEKQDYESKLQAKAAAKEKLAKATVSVANAVTGSTTAYATGDCESWLNEAGINNANARELIKRESHCNPCAYNPGQSDCNYKGNAACGIPQALPCSKLRDVAGCSMTDAVCQLKWMVSYVMGRYGSWEGAIAHHDAYGWY